jgi:branched-chain amino acid transport system substrate-binding protein
LAIDFQDTQSDPRQSVAVAQRLVADLRVMMELGDFSSAASMAASPIYQRGCLVQFGFTNSHPDFTKGGDYMGSNAPNQADDMPALADYAIRRLGFTRWRSCPGSDGEGGGDRCGRGLFAAEQDFRATLVRVRDEAPDALVLIAHCPDGAQ